MPDPALVITITVADDVIRYALIDGDPCRQLPDGSWLPVPIDPYWPPDLPANRFRCYIAQLLVLCTPEMEA